MDVLTTDYLVIGAGASGMAFADELVARSDAEVLLVDRRDRPGGHWLDCYPFVRLHQASANYGCNSRMLGEDRIDTVGPNAGFYERVSGVQIRAYYEQVLDTLLTQGQVRFAGLTDYVGDRSSTHLLTHRITGAHTEVRVRRRVVDTTYLEVKVPATHTPSFTADPDAHFVPPGELTNLAGAPSGFTVLGAGKTAMDACVWLLRNGVDPEKIRWVRPQEPWILDLGSLQPLAGLPASMQAMAGWVECLAAADSVPDLFARLVASGALLRLDPARTPTVFRGPILPPGDVEALRAIHRVVHLGRVKHLGAHRIHLEQGELPTDRGEVHVDCTAAGFRWAPPIPIWGPDRITLQSLIGGFTTQYAALIAYLEATRDDDTERNRLCEPVPQVTRDTDWIVMMRGFLRTGALQADQPDLLEWGDRSRVSFTRGMVAQLDDPRLTDALARWSLAAEPALERAERLLPTVRV